MSRIVTYVRIAAVTAGVLVHEPSLTPTALRVAWRLRAANWAHKFPFLPLPDRKYVDFRTHTAFASETIVPTKEDIHAYLQWCRRYAQYAR